MRAQMLDRKLRQERDTNVILVREAARLRIEQETHAARVARAQEVRSCVHACALAHTSRFFTERVLLCRSWTRSRQQRRRARRAQMCWARLQMPSAKCARSTRRSGPSTGWPTWRWRTRCSRWRSFSLAGRHSRRQRTVSSSCSPGGRCSRAPLVRMLSCVWSARLAHKKAQLTSALASCCSARSNLWRCRDCR